MSSVNQHCHSKFKSIWNDYMVAQCWHSNCVQMCCSSHDTVWMQASNNHTLEWGSLKQMLLNFIINHLCIWTMKATTVPTLHRISRKKPSWVLSRNQSWSSYGGLPRISQKVHKARNYLGRGIVNLRYGQPPRAKELRRAHQAKGPPKMGRGETPKGLRGGQNRTREAPGDPR